MPQIFGQMRLDATQHFGVNFRIAREDVAAFKKILSSGEIGDQSAGFLNDQRAGGHVPGAQSDLPEPFGAAAGDIGQVEGRRPGTADASGAQDERLQVSRPPLAGMAWAKRKTSA